MVYLSFRSRFGETYNFLCSRLSLAGGSADISRDDLLSRLLEPGSNEEDDKKLKKLSTRIRLNEAFSGVHFESVEWEIVNKGTYENRYTVIAPYKVAYKEGKRVRHLPIQNIL